MIRFDDKMPMSVEDYLLDCQRLLTPGDFRVANGLVSGDFEAAFKGNAFVRKWMNFEGCFRNEIAWYRSEKYHKNLDVLRGEPPCDMTIVGIIEQADEAENLLEAEKIIDQAKWHFLDQEDSRYQFTFENIIIFGLKLKIVERYQAIYSERGPQRLRDLRDIVLSDMILK